MHVFPFLSLQLLAACLAGATPNAANDSVKFLLAFEVMNGTSTAEVLSVDGGLDLPKLSPGANASTFDW
jgi:hypothetical protein